MTPLVWFGPQRAAPTGRSPFAALPFAPLPPSAVVPIGLLAQEDLSFKKFPLPSAPGSGGP